MLGKLIKYDNRAIGRILLPLYGGLILLALLNNLLRMFSGFRGDDDLLLQFMVMLGMLIYMLVVFAAMFATFFVLVSRFYKDMTQDEGYLTHTLPVGSGTLVGAKLLSGMLWIVIGTLAGVISGFCLFQPSEVIDFFDSIRPLFYQVSLILEEAQIAWVPYVVEFGLLMLISLPESLLGFYLAIAIGNQSNTHRILTSIAAYIGVGIAKQTLYTGVSFVTTIMEMRSTDMSGVTSFMHMTFVLSIVLEAGFCVAAFFLTRWLFQRKLNLA